jgi:thiosulfate/3-mercaptopyruvate sulfurtransferase
MLCRNTSLYSLFSLILSTFIVSACERPDATGTAAGQKEPVAYENINAADTFANPDVLVDTEWMLENLADPGVRVTDVSSKPEDYDEGRLPGASYVQWDSQLVNPGNPFEGKILTGEALSELMSSLGVSNDLTTETVAVTPGNYVAGNPDPQIATDWEYVVASIDDPSVRFCDARRPTEYAGEEMLSERGGHVPGAVNFEWTRTVKEDGTFLDAQTLDDLYEEAGFTPDQAIITYCQSGVRGAHTWFVLSELLGYPSVRNYDGSWSEYGNRADSPIQN